MSHAWHSLTMRGFLDRRGARATGSARLGGRFARGRTLFLGGRLVGARGGGWRTGLPGLGFGALPRFLSRALGLFGGAQLGFFFLAAAFLVLTRALLGFALELRLLQLPQRVLAPDRYPCCPASCCVLHKCAFAASTLTVLPRAAPGSRSAR